MKIWNSFSSDHSAKLKIIGSFKEIKDANKAAFLFNELINVDIKELESKSLIDGKLSEVLKKYNFHSFNENDPEQMAYFSSVKPEGKKIVVETDEEEIQAIIKIFMHYGAEIKIFSKHNYPNHE